jgi:hypothetical protein
MNNELKKKFQVIIDNIHPTVPGANGWGCAASRSGGGSTLESTYVLRTELPKLFDMFDIKSILDIPCGDFNWMKEINLTHIKYTGADILTVFVEENRLKYPQHEFLHLDITEDLLPKKDLIIVRDCFIHFSYENIKKSLLNIKSSESTYLLVSSVKTSIKNHDIHDADFRSVNMEVEPFSISPIHTIYEDDTRTMLLTKISDIKI